MASSSSGGYVSRYDVFLSFRGEDTRDSFTDHLYQALRRAGLYTFRDNDSISRGEDLQPKIEEGIRESRASIIVLSAKYATSRWCLDELCLILEQRKERDHFVLPIFYHVDPTHIRKQEGTFQINVVPNTKWTDDNVKRWKAALEKVSQMTGKVSISGPETIFLGEVVDIIKERLDLKQVYCQVNLVGMETRDKEINSWLEQSDSDIFAIWGMPGSGKTTLARHIVYSNWHKFESLSILQDIGSSSNEHYLRQLQKKLIKDIIEGKARTISSVWQGTRTIEDALQRKKALIVLDDIVTKKQLDALIGTEIKTKSKIIITTRERNSSKWFQSTSWRCQEHEMKLLDDGDSLELLSLYAFEPNAPINGYEELMKRALVYCGGNPLALQVLGSSLNHGSQEFWESTLTSFEREVPGDLKSVLITSYNLLQQSIQKQLFLHIACFFIGKDKDYVEKILGPDYCAKSEIVNLTNSCLLSVSPNNKLMMHQLLQAMARTIVDDESHTHPGNRSRIWRDGESYNVLIKEKGSTNVKGLALDMEVLGKQRIALGKKQLSDVVNTKSFEKMDSLQLLKLNQLKLTGTYQNIFKELRWLCWREFLLEAIPPELDMENLVAIDMSCSKLKVFQPPDVLPSLQILNLTDSHNLIEVKDISRVPNLDTLVLENCRSLVRVSRTLGDLNCLTSLNLTGCENMFNRTQPQFTFPNSLKHLFLMDCNLKDIHLFPPGYSFNNHPHLEYLNLAVNPCELLPSYTHLKNIRVLDLSSCTALKKLQCLPSKLRELYIFNCNSLESITFESHKFTLQEFRYEGCVNLSEVEDFFKIVPVAMLTGADLGHMNWLRAYQDLEVCLVGDDDLTKGRTLCLQMLYEFNIMSISLPNIEKPNMIPENEYTSEVPLLSFKIPENHRNRKLRGLNLTFKYTLQGDEWVWFAKIRTNNGVNLIYNAKVFGEPPADEVGIWLSYWPIGESLRVGDEVNVSIIVTEGLEIKGCSASLVYASEEDEDESFEDSNKSIVGNHESFEDANDFFEDNNEHADILGGDISGFKLTNGTYYLCRRDYSQLMEVGRLTPNWFRDLVGDTIDYTEIGGWRKTGRPDQPYQTYTELKTARCIIYGPELEEIYKIAEFTKSSVLSETVEDVDINETMKSTSSLFIENKGNLAPFPMLNLPTPYETSLAKFLTESGTFMDADLLVNRDGVRIVSQSQSDTPPLIQPSDNQLSLADFDAVKVVGKGNSGIVRLVQHKWTGQFFALKVIQMNVEESARKQIAQELKINQSSQSKNVVVCYQSFYDNGAVSIILEYMDGGSLADFLKTVRSIPEPYLAAICKQVLNGLWYLHHEKHIIHRDLKPSNLLINHRGEVKITDFGVSAILASTSGLANTFVGTYNYMSPERIIGGNYGYKSDIWSLGLVLLECATGHFPYSPPQPGEGWVNVYELMETIVGQAPPRAPADQFSPKFCSFIEACVQKDPNDRASANELMSHPFINMYDDMAVDLASYFTEAGSPLATL